MRKRDEERSRRFLDEIKIYYEETKDRLSEHQIDEVTWNDLEMDEVFLRLNETGSFIGEQVLYQRLHEPKGDAGWAQVEAQMEYYRKNESGRRKLEQQLAKIGKNQEDYYLPMFLMNADSIRIEHACLYRVLQILLAVSLVAGILSQNAVCIAVFVMTALCNLVVYAVSKWKYEIYLYALGSVKQLVLFGKMLVTKEEWSGLFGTDEIAEAVQSLDQLSKMIGNFWLRKRSLWTGDIMEILRDYLIGVTLWDLTVFGRIMKLIDGKQEELLKLYDFVGSVDMGIAIASFRENVPVYCIPEFCEQTAIEAVGFYHPLLKKPVPNDFFLKKGCLITGANASGKSTFIKALALNVILAQTIHTCTADRFCLPPIRVMTSIAVRDDIISGESYYIRELRYLKRMIDSAQEGVPLLCIIDEILRGTNTRERLAASEAILKYLDRENVLAVAATHDMELVENLKERYDSYYFTSEIREKDIFFDYKIHAGVGHSQNAIRLLAYFDFPEEILADCAGCGVI